MITKLFTLKYGLGTDWTGTAKRKVLSTTLCLIISFFTRLHVIVMISYFLFLLLVLLTIVGKSTAMSTSTFYLKSPVPIVITSIVTILPASRN